MDLETLMLREGLLSFAIIPFWVIPLSLFVGIATELFLAGRRAWVLPGAVLARELRSRWLLAAVSLVALALAFGVQTVVRMSDVQWTNGFFHGVEYLSAERIASRSAEFDEVLSAALAQPLVAVAVLVLWLPIWRDVAKARKRAGLSASV